MPGGVRRVGGRDLLQLRRRQLRRLAVAVPQTRELRAQRRLPFDASCLEERLDERPLAHRERRQRRGLSGEQPRIVQRAAQDEPRHRVEVCRHRLAAEPHRLQRNRSAPRERIQHPRRPPAERRADLGAEPRDLLDALRLALAPPVQDPAPRLLRPLAAAARNLRHPPRHPPEQLPAPLRASRIGQQRRQQRRPTRRQRPPRRPDVQRGDVPVPHVLLVHGVEGDLSEREGGLDEAGVGHRPLSPSAASPRNTIAAAVMCSM